MSRTLLAALAAGTILVPLSLASAQAQSYSASSRYDPQPQSYENCVREQRNRQVAGAVIGGLIGAVLGAELHDDHQDANREHRRYRGDRHYRDRGYHRNRHDRRRDRRHRRDRHHEEGNDGAVVAGGAVGAVAGAAIAGGRDCDRYARGYGYDDGYGHDYRESDYRYDERGYGYEDDYRYDDGYSYDRPSSGTLLGGEDYQRETRTYRAETRRSGPSGQACRTMQNRNGSRVFMCQGADGIWRPAD